MEGGWSESLITDRSRPTVKIVRQTNIEQGFELEWRTSSLYFMTVRLSFDESTHVTKSSMCLGGFEKGGGSQYFKTMTIQRIGCICSGRVGGLPCH